MSIKYDSQFYAILCNPWISSAIAMAMSIYGTLCVLVYSTGTAFFLPENHLLAEGSLLTTLTFTLGKSWIISFSLFPTDYSYSHWTNCFQLRSSNRTGEDDQSILLDISFRGEEGMRIKTREFSGGSEVAKVDLPLLPVKTWTEVKVEKKRAESNNRYQIFINESLVRTFTEKKTRTHTSTGVQESQEVKVYASAPGRRSQPGNISELSVEIAGNNNA